MILDMLICFGYLLVLVLFFFCCIFAKNNQDSITLFFRKKKQAFFLFIIKNPYKYFSVLFLNKKTLYCVINFKSAAFMSALSLNLSCVSTQKEHTIERDKECLFFFCVFAPQKKALLSQNIYI